MIEDAEREFVVAAREGAPGARAKLFEENWLDAWRTARAVTGSDHAAEDIAQSAFERAFQGLPQFNGASSFRTWLHRIVVNLALNHLRDESRSVPVEAVPDRDTPGQGEGELDAIAALSGLSPERRAVVVLRVCLDYTLAETAEILGVPVGTVQSRQARGLSQLRDLLGGGT